MTSTSSLMSPEWEERRGRAGLQALRERVVRQERHGARPPALPLQGVRPQLHGHAAPRQAAGDEGAGGAAPRPGQRQPGDDRQAARGQPRRGLYKWVRKAGEDAPAPSATPSSDIVQIDEMWHFVDGKKTRFGSGGPSTLWHGEPWPGSWVGVMTRPVGDFSTRSASTATSS